MSNEAREVKRYRVSYMNGVIEEDGSPRSFHDSEPMVLATAYDALAASHAELVGLIAALLPAAESALHEANRGCGAPAWGDAIAQARLALTRAKALV